MGSPEIDDTMEPEWDIRPAGDGKADLIQATEAHQRCVLLHPRLKLQPGILLDKT
jgi:hypothetical protein